jgi:hypothetical protein
MGEVVATQVFAQARTRAIYEKLIGKLAASYEEIRRNPWPALDAAGDEIVRLRTALDAAYRELRPLPVWEDEKAPVVMHDIGADAVGRAESAARVLSAALHDAPREPRT